MSSSAVVAFQAIQRAVGCKNRCLGSIEGLCMRRGHMEVVPKHRKDGEVEVGVRVDMVIPGDPGRSTSGKMGSNVYLSPG